MVTRVLSSRSIAAFVGGAAPAPSESLLDVSFPQDCDQSFPCGSSPLMGGKRWSLLGCWSSRGGLAAEPHACARSSGQRHSPDVPLGCDTHTSVGAGGGSRLGMGSACPSMSKQQPQTSSRGFARGAEKVRTHIGGCVCAGPCWGAGPLGCCFSLEAKSKLCHLLVPRFPHLCKTRRRSFPRVAQQELACWGKAQEWQTWRSCSPCWGCPRVLFTLGWLQRLKSCRSPRGAGQPHLSSSNGLERCSTELSRPALKPLQVPPSSVRSSCTWGEMPPKPSATLLGSLPPS